MPILTLKFKNKAIKEYRLEHGSNMTIGRRSTNDIVIENLAVSGLHAKVDSMDGGFLLTDLQSKNGTFVNEKLVTSHWLKEGETVMIGKHTVTFSYAKDELRPQEADDNATDATMVMDTTSYRDMVAKSSPEQAAPAPKTPSQVSQAPQPQPQPPSQGGNAIGVLTYLAGGTGDIELTNKIVKLGKNKANDIVISGFMVGQTAAAISNRPNGYHIGYVGGMAKPKVNGETVKESVLLKEFDVIEIGSTKFQFMYQA
ncbi:FHA domain-containing protein [Desulfococcaceae bacterium HSG9]|nr:FHA domain-containing protein [Desulfococcaceae bacterium HSG9]